MDWFISAAKKLLDNDYDLLADTINVSIHTSSYTFSSAHDFFDDITNEVSGTNYTAGGLTLSNKSTSAADPSVFDADDGSVTQSGAGFSNGRNLIVYKSTGTASTSPVITRFGATADFGNVSGALTIQWAATGIVRADLQ